MLKVSNQIYGNLSISWVENHPKFCKANAERVDSLGQIHSMTFLKKTFSQT